MKARYYQARYNDNPDHYDLDRFNAEAPPGGPPAIGVSVRVVFSPDIFTHLCEATPSIYFDVLDYQIEFGPGVGYDDMPDEVASYWQDLELEFAIDVDGYYIHAHEVLVDRWEHSPDVDPEFKDWLGTVVLQGEYGEDEDQTVDDLNAAARDDAQGNHLV